MIRSFIHRQLNRPTIRRPRGTSAAIALTVAVVAMSPAARAEAACSEPVSLKRVERLGKLAPSLKRDVLALALAASDCAAQEGVVKRRNLLTVIDYSLPSTEKRLWVFDVEKPRLLFHEHVSHGVNSGQNRTTSFSNVEGSRQTSLGLFVTAETYVGRNGYSLRMNGLDKGFNDLARRRAIVMHGAPYVNPEAARRQGRLGRSWGCPAVRSSVAKSMIDTIKGGAPIFAYYPDDRWISSSKYLAHSRQPATRTASLQAGR